jgi:uroporphyrinogen decarboxylase
MTSRERVLRNLSGKETDRQPFYLRFEHDVSKRVADHYNIKESELEAFYGIDAIRTWPRWLPVWHGVDGEYKDVYGNIHNCGGTVIKPALHGIETVGDLDKVEWINESLLDREQNRKIMEAAASTDHCVLGGVWASIFTGIRHMFGEIEFLTGLYDNPLLVKTAVERLTDALLRINKVYMDEFHDKIDIFYFGSDYGTQASMFISPEHFREFFAPHMKRIADQAHGYWKKVMFHTCGSVHPIIGDLIDCGVSAEGMDVDSIAKRFKGKIAFCGGISNQITFTTGTPEEVYAETVHAIKTLGPLNYIPAPDHDLIGDVPVANVDAFVRAVKEYKL